MALNRHGIPVAFVAYNGCDAVELFKNAEIKPDIIIMDYAMPGLNGVETARQILAISPGVKIIFLSGQRLSDEEALNAGGITLIRKPASIHMIINAIRTAD
jgi:CheY-like chemotaxis protein